MDYWKPNATVAAVVEQDGRFLMVEETTREGLRLNQPSGHLDPGETLAQAVVREALEETAHHVEPTACVGVYMSRYRYEPTDTDVTYLRFAFACQVIQADPERRLIVSGAGSGGRPVSPVWERTRCRRGQAPGGPAAEPVQST